MLEPTSVTPRCRKGGPERADNRQKSISSQVFPVCVFNIHKKRAILTISKSSDISLSKNVHSFIYEPLKGGFGGDLTIRVGLDETGDGDKIISEKSAQNRSQKALKRSKYFFKKLKKRFFCMTKMAEITRII